MFPTFPQFAIPARMSQPLHPFVNQLKSANLHSSSHVTALTRFLRQRMLGPEFGISERVLRAQRGPRTRNGPRVRPCRTGPSPGIIMPRTDLAWRTRRPAEGFYTSEVQSPNNLPVRTFLPIGYEPNYPYPLLVFLHGHGSNEEQALRLAPKLSRRNYVAISLRGPRRVDEFADRRGYTWDADGENESFIDDYVIKAVEETRRNYH